MSDLSRMDRRKKPQKSTEERNAIIEELVRDREGSFSPPKKRLKKKKSTGVKKVVLSLVLVLLLFTGYKVYDFVKSPLNAAEPVDTDIEEPVKPLPSEDDEFAKKRVNILILGVDEREGEVARADTIILASLFPEEKQVKLLSIPRDTRLLIPGHGNDKINHAHVYGGINLVKNSVEEFTGIPIDFYVETNFKGFINIIDLLGGVTINVEKKMYTPLENIDLEPGLQNLNGYDSLAYVRYRDDGMGDIGRIARQQRFIKTLAESTIKTSNISKIPGLVDEMKAYVKTDLSIMDMITYSTRFAKMDPADLEAFQVPGFSGMQNEVSYWIPDLNGTKKIVSSIKKPTVKDPLPEADLEKDKENGKS